MVLDPEPETTPEPFQRPEPAGADVRARFMTGGGYRLLVSANFGELVLGCIEAKFASKYSLELARWKALAEIYKMHSFVQNLPNLFES